MDTHLTPRSADYTGNGPRGRVWVIAGFYMFAAVMLTGWATGWWQNAPHAVAPPVMQHSTHG
jgi:hypothetical protein